MRRLVVLLVLAVLCVPVCFAQGGPEADALIDALYSKDINGILAHLPPELAKLYGEFSPMEKARLASRLPLVKIVADEIKITRGYGAGPVLLLEPIKPGHNADDKVEIYIDKRLTDGTETLLRIRIELTENGERKTETANLLLRYVDGEWRLYEAQSDRDRIKLDDPNFLSGLHGGSGPTQEASALVVMRTFNTALVVYATTYPHFGYPQAIEQLGTGETCAQPSAEHACLVDDKLATPPFEKSGYRYTYERISNDQYTIIGRPITYSDQTKRSFFTDQSGVIRSTTDDREPTVEDTPFQ